MKNKHKKQSGGEPLQRLSQWLVDNNDVTTLMGKCPADDEQSSLHERMKKCTEELEVDQYKDDHPVLSALRNKQKSKAESFISMDEDPMHPNIFGEELAFTNKRREDMENGIISDKDLDDPINIQNVISQQFVDRSDKLGLDYSTAQAIDVIKKIICP